MRTLELSDELSMDDEIGFCAFSFCIAGNCRKVHLAGGCHLAGMDVI
jgi:hypothetical protein